MQGAPRPPMLEQRSQANWESTMMMLPLPWVFSSLCPTTAVSRRLDGACSPVPSQLGHVRLLAEAMRAGPRTWLRLLRDYGIEVTGWETLGEREASNQVQIK